MSDNIIDKATNDDTKIVITSRSVKWIIGILTTAVLGILGFAWGLYIRVDGKVDTKFKDLDTKMTDQTTKIIQKIDDLEDVDLKEIEKSNNKQDVDIGRLYERTDSYSDRLNGNANRPTTLDNDSNTRPTFGN
jgi:hypothetical protein